MNLPPLAGQHPDWPAPTHDERLLELDWMVSCTEKRLHRLWVPDWCSVTRSTTTGRTHRWNAVKGVCPVCGREPEMKRRTYCTTYCRDLAAICSNPRAARAFIWERDGHRCVECPEGVWPLSLGGDDWAHRPDGRRLDDLTFAARPMLTDAERREIWARVYPGPRLMLTWEVDHIHELADGGSMWPSNMQLLCSYHHKVKTAASQAARRAAA